MLQSNPRDITIGYISYTAHVNALQYPQTGHHKILACGVLS